MDSGYRRRKLFDDDDEDEGGAQGKIKVGVIITLDYNPGGQTSEYQPEQTYQQPAAS
jgi:hypothetical protein